MLTMPLWRLHVQAIAERRLLVELASMAASVTAAA